MLNFSHLKNFTLSILATILFLVFSTESMAQSVNDYRSIGSGNWTTLLVWEVYNGFTWLPATTYPGQVAGTNNVLIVGGHSVTLSASVPNAFNSLTIGDGIGATDTFLIGSNASINTLQFTIANGGFISWTSNVTLTLPAGTAFVIEPGGSIDISNPCNAAKRIVIGSTLYSSCNGGGGASYSFSQLNTSGGSLNVSPSSNGPICSGGILNLFSNAAGIGASSATFNWSATGPSDYSFSSTLTNPTVPGLVAGTYLYTVVATSGSISNSNSLEVIVNAAPNTPASTGSKTMCTGGTVPTLTANVNSGETVDWYSATSGGTLLLSGNTSYTPATAGTFYAEARNSATNCISSTRTEINIVSASCKVITNRHIKSRVIIN